MSTTHITTGLAVFALMIGSGVTQAASEDSAFQTLDTDANGYISADEATGNQDLHARWSELDKDNNNQLDQAEFSAFEAGTDSMKGTDHMMQEGTMQKPMESPSSPTE